MSQPREDAIVVEMDPDLEDLVPAYLERRKGELAAMDGLLAAGDLAGLARLAHDLKGSGGGYGLPELTRLGRELEAACKAGDAAGAAALRAELGEYLARVRLVAAGA